MISPYASRRLLPVLATASTPVAAVFVVLVAAGQISPLAAAAALVASVGLIALFLYPYCCDVTEISRYARDLVKGDDRPAPYLRTELATDLLAALGNLRRQWRNRQEELATQVNFHEVLFDTLPSPLFLLNGQRRIVRANEAATRIFGRQQQGRDLAAFMRNPDLLEAVEEVLEGGPGRGVEFTLPGPAACDFRAMIEPLPQAADDGTVAVLSLHDVTELKRMEQMRADFVANASHELRTPLAVLLGFIETLSGPARDDAEARERFLVIMHEQATRMSRLVADLLNLSRIELHEHSKPTGRADLAAILRRIATSLELQAEKRRMRIDLALADQLPAVAGKEDELAQIFQNLMDNALKYGREGSPVEVAACVTSELPTGMAERGRAAVAVAVRDRGEGIAREHLPRLTERFFRVDAARSRSMGGTGLGLAIVKHVVNRHRGALTIDSTLGEGSCFTVYLPLAEGRT